MKYVLQRKQTILRDWNQQEARVLFVEGKGMLLFIFIGISLASDEVHKEQSNIIIAENLIIQLFIYYCEFNC